MISYKRSIVIPVSLSLMLVLIGIGIMTRPTPSLVGIVYLLLALPVMVYSYFLRQQGEVFVLTTEVLEYQRRIGGKRQRISLKEIGTIRYQIVPVYHEIQSGRLTIIDKDSIVLTEIKLNTLSGVDFNDLYHFIETAAPHIQWEFNP